MALAAFEELDYAITPLGELILRRREVLSLDRAEVFEVKLDGQFLMSSLVNQAEIELATCALPVAGSTECDVLVGGLGLGCTGKAALDAANVRSVTVIEYLDPVIGWHRRKLVPLGEALTGDPRCSLIHGDFFAAMAPRAMGVQPSEQTDQPVAAIGSKRYHAILLDIDHSPQCLLQAAHAAFYTPEGLKEMADRLHPGGVFALWSADPPEQALLDALAAALPHIKVHESRFFNPLLTREDVNYIVVACPAPCAGSNEVP